jgi:putative spermidine/putrescine transport system substrate-binding protein
MIDRSQDIDVEETCARLRKLLMATRGVGRREFIKALGQTLGGSALLSLLPRMVPDAAAAEQPVTAFVFGGVWKKSAVAAFGEPFTKKTGIPVVYQDPYTFAKLRAMHEAKAMQVDVVSVQGGEMFQANG